MGERAIQLPFDFLAELVAEGPRDEPERGGHAHIALADGQFATDAFSADAEEIATPLGADAVVSAQLCSHRVCGAPGAVASKGVMARKVDVGHAGSERREVCNARPLAWVRERAAKVGCVMRNA